MIRNFCAVCCLLWIAVNVQAQEDPFADSLKLNLGRASTPEQSVFWLGQLSNYYMSIDRALAEEYAVQQQQVAEVSRDRKLIIVALLSNARRHYNLGGLQDNINKGRGYAQQASDLARSSQLTEMEAWSSIYLAMGANANGEYEKALTLNNTALSLANGVDSDSLKVYAYSFLADTYLAKKEMMLAFRNYLQALEVAEKSDSYFLLKAGYRNMAKFYQEIGDYEKAKDNLYKIIAITKRFGRRIDRLDPYNTLGLVYTQTRQYDLAESFYNKALALADTLKLESVKINTYFQLIDMYAADNKVDQALQLFKAHPELTTFLKRAGFSYFIDHAYGMGYTQMGKLDSAYYYLKRAEPVLELNASKSNRFWFYNNMVRHFKKREDYKNALVYAKKAEILANDMKNLSLRMRVAEEMDFLYRQRNDFKNAYAYGVMHRQLEDSLEQLSAEKDLLSLEIENENKRKAREILLAEEATRARHNIQYMGITVAIVAVFILLVMFGIFKVSHTTIRVLGFFAFIFLFEFIILIADNKIHHWTHGEPWKILAIKIGLISILLPLHHFLEEKVIHYLTSRKLLELNKGAILARFVSRKQSAD